MTQNRKTHLHQLGLSLGTLGLLGCQSGPNLKPSEARLPQVISAWPFMVSGEKWSAKELIQKVRPLGAVGVELLDVKHWPLLKEANMVCAATKSHTFVRGMNNKNHHAECLEKLNQAIDDTANAGFPNVMTFTGMLDTSKEKNGSKVSLEQGIKNCIEGYKKIVAKAEKKKVTLILEPLNTRDSEHMKGHPGYMGDHIDICMQIIKAVGSPSLKLLFDVYHIQIMDGDLIRHMQEVKDYIGHVQIAGVPGRGPITKDQEVNYPAIMKSFVDLGYTGYVAHEWIPTGNPYQQLKSSIETCRI